MEQLDLFAPSETIKNKATNALAEAKFIQSEKYWRELEFLNPGNGFIGTALDMCRFWNDLYPDDDMLNRADSLEIYKRWREFEAYLDCREYRGRAIIGQIKKSIFLRRMGLEDTSQAVRASFERHGIEVLDLLMEIEEWALAEEEIRAVRMRSPLRGGGAFLLKCFKVYYRRGKTPASRRSLLRAFWEAPDLIKLHDIVDPELRKELGDLYPDSDAREDSVELIPYVGLMTGSFTLPLDDRPEYLSNLRKNAERHERNYGVTGGTRIRYRLFSLYAWESEVAQLIGASYVGPRNRMKTLDSDLFVHYMDRKRHLEGGRLLSIQR